MRITKVYTRTGDDGQTGLAGGQRVPKDHARIEAYGTVDELNSVIGVAVTTIDDSELLGHLNRIQHLLFDVGGDLCVLHDDKVRYKMQPFPEEPVTWLEGLLDAASVELPALEEFVLPGGHPGAAHLHVARTVCRRAERRCLTLAGVDTDVTPFVIPFLNRLSDALFVFARLLNHRSGHGDVLWKKAHRSPGQASA